MSETMRPDFTPDGVADEFGEDLRLGLLIATQGAHRMIQMFTDAKREQARESREQAQQFQAEVQAHHAMAMAATRNAGSDRWWQETSPRDIAHAWEVARTWEGRDPELSERAQAIREGLSDRYGIADPDTMTVKDLVDAARDDRGLAAQAPLAAAQWEESEYGQLADRLRDERRRLETDAVKGRESGWSAPGGGDYQDGWLQNRIEGLGELERDAHLEQRHAGDRADRLVEHGAKPGSGREWEAAWDTPERRERLRSHLVEAGVPADAVRARLLADHAQGRPPSEAARTVPTGRGQTPARHAAKVPHQQRRQTR